MMDSLGLGSVNLKPGAAHALIPVYVPFSILKTKNYSSKNKDKYYLVESLRELEVGTPNVSESFSLCPGILGMVWKD